LILENTTFDKLRSNSRINELITTLARDLNVSEEVAIKYLSDSSQIPMSQLKQTLNATCSPKKELHISVLDKSFKNSNKPAKKFRKKRSKRSTSTSIKSRKGSKSRKQRTLEKTINASTAMSSIINEIQPNLRISEGDLHSTVPIEKK
jgi:hypothetical protein